MKNIIGNKLYVPIQINGSSDDIAPPYKLHDRELFVGSDGSLFVGIGEGEGGKNIGINALTSEKAKTSIISQSVGVSENGDSFVVKSVITPPAAISNGQVNVKIDFTSLVNTYGKLTITGRFSVPEFVPINGISYFNLVSYDNIIVAGPYSRYGNQLSDETFTFELDNSNEAPHRITAVLVNTAGRFIMKDVIATTDDGVVVWRMNEIGGADYTTQVFTNLVGSISNADITLYDLGVDYPKITARGSVLTLGRESDNNYTSVDCEYVPPVIGVVGKSLYGSDLPTNNATPGQLFFLIQQ